MCKLVKISNIVNCLIFNLNKKIPQRGANLFLLHDYLGLVVMCGELKFILAKV